VPRWSDVDLENGRLSVRRALIPINREVVVSEPKTARGRRVIALDPATVEVLKGQATRQLDEQKEWDETWIDTGLVFTQENGAALDPESVSRYFRQAVKKSLLPQIHLHDLRYSHAIPAMQEEATALIAELVFARASPAASCPHSQRYSSFAPPHGSRVDESDDRCTPRRDITRPSPPGRPRDLRRGHLSCCEIPPGGYRRTMICITTSRTTSATTELKSMPTAPRRAIGRRRKSAK